MTKIDEILDSDPILRARMEQAETAYRKEHGEDPPGARKTNGRAAEDAGEQHKADSPSALPLAVLFDDLKLSREVFWAIDDILPRVEQMLVYGPGGSGKTYLASSIAIGIAQGRWFNHDAEQGATLCCAFERPDDAEDRFAAIRDRHQFHGLPVALLKLPGFGMSETIAEHIVAQGKAIAEKTGKPVKTVIIDTTSAALAGGKEDDQGLGWLPPFRPFLSPRIGCLSRREFQRMRMRG